MKKIYDNLIFDRLKINFVKSKNLLKYSKHFEYQILEVSNYENWQQNHILFSCHLTPLNFISDYKNVLDKNKKIIIFGSFHSLAYYYRFLKNKGYNVYLIKDRHLDLIDKNFYY